MKKVNINKTKVVRTPQEETIRLAINQISIQNCDGSVNEDGIKAVRLLQEIDIEKLKQ
tara:strand:+ start:489 stop:662 length:174 start_codon:yes stop_codon:yes gene_type:complete